MRNDGNDGKKLTALLKRLKKGSAGVEPPSSNDPVRQLVISLLQYDSTFERAVEAYDRAHGRDGRLQRSSR